MDGQISEHTTACRVCNLSDLDHKYCGTCQTKLCQGGVEDHCSHDVTDGHHIVLFVNRTRYPKYNKCKLHCDVKCELFCEPCRDSICWSCSLSPEHNDHKIDEILPLFQSQTTSIMEDKDEVQNSLIPQCNAFVTDIEKEIANVEGDYEEVLNSITKQEEEWICAIKHVSTEYKTNVTKNRTKHKTILNEIKQDTENLIQQAKETTENITEILTANDVTMSMEYKSKNLELLDSLKKLKSIDFTEMRRTYLPTFHPRSLNKEEEFELFGSLSTYRRQEALVEKTENVAQVATSRQINIIHQDTKRKSQEKGQETETETKTHLKSAEDDLSTRVRKNQQIHLNDEEKHFYRCSLRDISSTATSTSSSSSSETTKSTIAKTVTHTSPSSTLSSTSTETTTTTARATTYMSSTTTSSSKTQDTTKSTITTEKTTKYSKQMDDPAAVPKNRVVSRCYKVLCEFDSHDGEVNAIRWSPSGLQFATGGGDKTVKLWQLSEGKWKCTETLMGSNAGIMSLDFNPMETLIVGASNDGASRVWGIRDCILKQTLTGHNKGVTAAKFLTDSHKIVSGSHDRTLKIWDLERGSCIHTMNALSICNDLVKMNGTNILSGHFDHRLRFWDTRMDKPTNEVLLQEKVTSLDISTDKMNVLCSTRSDTLEVFDLRKNQIVTLLEHDDFKVPCDWSRAVFSPDASYAMAGSSNGAVFIFNIKTGKVEDILQKHTSPVLACSWHSSLLLSCEKHRKTILWTSVNY